MIANVIVLLIVGSLLVLAVRKLYRDQKSGKTSCAGCSGCSGCSMSGSCHQK